MTNTDRFNRGDQVIWFDLGIARLGRFDSYDSLNHVKIRPDGSMDKVSVPCSDVLILNRRVESLMSVATSFEAANIVREHSGEWVVIREVLITGNSAFDKEERAKLSNVASLIKQGRLKTYSPRGTFDAYTGSSLNAQGHPVVRLHVSYVGVSAEAECG